jgi:hypothetical protein
MRAPILGTLAVATLAIAGCAPAADVLTVTAPDPGLSTLRTFQVVPARENDPYLDRALGHEIAASLSHRGYFASATNPDVLIEYGTAAPDLLDPTDWDSEYLWRSASWRGWGPGSGGATQAEFENGAVVIDVLDARTKHLLWRGHAEADASADPHTYVRNLDQAVNDILNRFPEGSLATR